MPIEVTDEMVEKAARQICDAWGYIWDGNPGDDSQIAPDNDEPYDERPSKRLYRDAAREALRAVLPLIAAAEREECAKVADELGAYVGSNDDWGSGEMSMAARISAAIRSRS